MKRLQKYITCLGLILLVLPVSRVYAQDGFSGKVGGIVEFFDEDENNAKFNEYRYKQDEEFGGQAYFDMLLGPGEGSHQLEGHFLWRSPEDMDAEVEHLWLGKHRLNVDYQRMGHVFAYDVKTPYSGQGTGTLTIPDSIQANLQSAPDDANMINRLIPQVEAGNVIDLQLRRDKIKADYELFVLNPFTLRMGLDYEQREGTRPYNGNFGFGNSVELSEPIDYETTSVWAELEFNKDPYYGKVRVFHSTFNNTIESLLYDNPFRNVDGTSSVAYIRSRQDGPRTGLNSLPPDNYSNGFTVTMSHELPLHSRLTGNASFGWNRQDENLLPPTTNSAIGPLPLPRQSADAKVDTELYDIQWAAHPINKLHVKAAFRYRSHENRTKVEFFQRVRSDATVEPDWEAEYVSYIMRTLEGELSYEVLDRTTLTFIFEMEGNSFENGSANKENIYIYEAAIDSWALDWLRLQMSTTLTDKNSEYPDNLPALSELPWQRKYYAATKTRFAAHGMGTIVAADWLSFTLDYTYGQDDYEFSPFGLEKGRDHAATASMDLQVADWMNFSAFYTYENYLAKQKSRQWNPTVGSNGIGDPFNAFNFIDHEGNWTLETDDNVHTVGFNANVRILPEKLTGDLDGTYTTVNSDADFESPVGTSGVNDNNAFVPQDFNQVDETKLTKLHARLTYSVNKNLDILGGFIYEDWQIEDYQYDGLTQVVVTGSGGYNGLLNMDTLYKDYTVNTAYVGAEWRFE